jgi:dolichol-phosphate mannosyltransferase
VELVIDTGDYEKYGSGGQAICRDTWSTRRSSRSPEMIQTNRSSRFLAGGPQLSVVIPVHDEQGNVLPLAAELNRALDGHIAYEVIFVDDASADQTLDRLKSLATRDRRVRVIRHRETCGQSTAIHTGVCHARGHWIATLDGDGQNDPADIPRLLAVLRDGRHDPARTLVVGHRVKRRDSALVRLSSRVANGVRARLLRDRTPDTGCGLKVFDRGMFLALPYFDHMHRFLPALVRRAGGDVVIVRVNHRPRRSGRSHYGVHNRLWTGIVDLLGVMWLSRRARLPDLSELVITPESSSATTDSGLASDTVPRVATRRRVP